MSSAQDITLTAQEQDLITRLKGFRVPEMAQARADKRFNRLMKEAHLRYPAADLDETIYRPERQLDTQTIERLSTCHWIEEKISL